MNSSNSFGMAEWEKNLPLYVVPEFCTGTEYQIQLYLEASKMQTSYVTLQSCDENFLLFIINIGTWNYWKSEKRNLSFLTLLAEPAPCGSSKNDIDYEMGYTIQNQIIWSYFNFEIQWPS